VHPL